MTTDDGAPMIAGKPKLSNRLKSATHHWWPKTLSRRWQANDGKVTQLFWDGREVREPGKGFGGIQNAHHIKFGEDEVWNASFEEAFHGADDCISDLVEWLQDIHFEPTLASQALPDQRRMQLSGVISSLIVRSPRMRNNVRCNVERLNRAFGEKNPKADKTIIAANLCHCHHTYTQGIFQFGNFVVLKSETRELIFGDGFLHNFPPKADFPTYPLALISLLPNVAVLLTPRPMPSRLSAKRIEEVHTRLMNEVVQIYSKDFVFYRTQKPYIYDHFSKREFQRMTWRSVRQVEATLNA